MSNKQQLTKSKAGFTIIEVVLVLAIAGLIFLMVFVALPALQRSQRDTQRREDVSRVANALTQYQTNNGGALPPSKSSATSLKDTLVKNYLDGDNFKGPSGDPYLVYIYEKSNNSTIAGKGSISIKRMHIYTYANCDGELPVYSSAARNYAIVLKLEGAGYYCLDNK